MRRDMADSVVSFEEAKKKQEELFSIKTEKLLLNTAVWILMVWDTYTN